MFVNAKHISEPFSFSSHLTVSQVEFKGNGGAGVPVCLCVAPLLCMCMCYKMCSHQFLGVSLIYIKNSPQTIQPDSLVNSRIKASKYF